MAEYIIFGKPFIGEEEIAEVVDSLRRGWLGTGPKVKQFEEGFRSYVGADHAAALHSCTAALFLSQLALGIGSGDAVVTTPLTFVSTANAIRHTGAVPLFADVDAETGLLDPDAVARLITEECDLDPADGRPIHRRTRSKIRALMPVHLWGQPADMVRLRELCDQFRLLLIEDAAHAVEATVGDRKVGTTADISCFSFYATKNLCTGEGGMVTSSRGDLIERVRRLALHGLSLDAWKRFSDAGYRHYTVVESGWKFNMMDLQAAIGIHQLARLSRMHDERVRQWHAYRAELGEIAERSGIGLPPAEAEHGRHARHLFTLRIRPTCRLSRDQFMAALHQRDVGTGVHFEAMTSYPAFADADRGPLPCAEAIGRETLSIPLGGALDEASRVRVVAAIRDVAEHG